MCVFVCVCALLHAPVGLMHTDEFGQAFGEPAQLDRGQVGLHLLPCRDEMSCRSSFQDHVLQIIDDSGWDLARAAAELGDGGCHGAEGRGSYYKSWSSIASATARTTLMFGWCCSTRCVWFCNTAGNTSWFQSIRFGL